MPRPEIIKESKIDAETERQLMAKLQAGTDVEDSFRQLFSTYVAAIEQYFLRQRLPAEVAEDLTQDTFVNAYRYLHTYRGEASPKTWLLSVAKSVWLNELRRRSAVKRAAKEVPLDDLDFGAEDGFLRTERTDLIDALLHKEQRRMIVEELRRLPPQMRQCMFLRVLQDLKYREIGVVLGVSTQTVRSQLFRARGRLQESLKGVELNG